MTPRAIERYASLNSVVHQLEGVLVHHAHVPYQSRTLSVGRTTISNFGQAATDGGG
jgi:hypothetical protein